VIVSSCSVFGEPTSPLTEPVRLLWEVPYLTRLSVALLVRQRTTMLDGVTLWR
jgi:hypothetical protein